MSEQPDFITVAEVARRLDVCKHTAYTYLAPGGCLEHLRAPLGGRTVRVDRKAFEAYLLAPVRPA